MKQEQEGVAGLTILKPDLAFLKAGVRYQLPSFPFQRHKQSVPPERWPAHQKNNKNWTKKKKNAAKTRRNAEKSSEEISTGFSGDATRSVRAQQMIRSQADMAVTGRVRGGEGGGGRRRGGYRERKGEEECGSHGVTGERHRGENSRRRWQVTQTCAITKKTKIKQREPNGMGGVFRRAHSEVSSWFASETALALSELCIDVRGALSLQQKRSLGLQ